MAQPPAPDPVRDYIRANMATHTRDAIRNALIRAGHDAARVDATWLEEWRGATATHDDLVPATAGYLATLAWILLAIGAVVGGLGALLAASIAGTYAPEISVPVFIGLYALIYFGIGYGLVRLVRAAVERLRLTGWGAFVLGVLMLPSYGFLMYGGCIAAFSIAQGSGA